MIEKLYLSAYYDDPDHPSGIVIVEINMQNFDNYKILKAQYEDFKAKKSIKLSNNYFDVIEVQKNTEFVSQLYKEVCQICEENKVIGKDTGWNEFENLNAYGWIIFELSHDIKALFNDSFWEV
jgi:hypothetical protein